MAADLISSSTRALVEYIGNAPTTQAVQAFGSKSALAQHLAGTSDKSSTAYRSQMRSINRWLAYESGQRGTNVRNPFRSGAANRLAGAAATQAPPSGMDIKIVGTIRVSGDQRYRTVHINTADHAINTGAVISDLAEGNTEDAWREVFADYCADMVVVSADTIDVAFF